MRGASGPKWKSWVKAFSEIAQPNGHGFKVVQPEDGLLYAACMPEFPVENWGPKIIERWPGRRHCIMGSFGDRIVGRYSWIPPILSLDIPSELIARLLTHNFYFYVFMDVGHVKRRIASLAPNVGVTELEGAIAFKIRKGEWSVSLGPRPVERVLYGLGSLGSALQTLATMAEDDIDPESIAEKFGGLSQRSR